MLSEMIKRDQKPLRGKVIGVLPMKHSLPRRMNSLLPCSKRESSWTLPACMLPLSNLVHFNSEKQRFVMEDLLLPNWTS